MFDTGSEDGIRFIVMEDVEGETLASIIRREGPLEPGRAAEIAGEVCDALASAHDTRLVHRDIKPGNLMVTRSGAVKVMDFGIARALTGAPRSPGPGPRWGRRPTCLLSRQRGDRQTAVRICTPWAARSTRCSPASLRSGAISPWSWPHVTSTNRRCHRRASAAHRPGPGSATEHGRGRRCRSTSAAR